MITNFKSDYGNLLLSGLATTELNIPWQIKSGSRKFLRFTRLLGLEDERQPEKDWNYCFNFVCPTSNIPSQSLHKIPQFTFPRKQDEYFSCKEAQLEGEKRGKLENFLTRNVFVLRFFGEENWRNKQLCEREWDDKSKSLVIDRLKEIERFKRDDLSGNEVLGIF